MMEQYHVAAADGQTPLVMSGGHVVMQALSGQMSGGQTLQSTAGQVNVCLLYTSPSPRDS